MGSLKTDTRRMALDLLVTAREVLGYEFPSQEALEKYLKDHPKAKKENHWVKDQKPEKNPQDSQGSKSQEKTEDSASGKFAIPEHKLLKFETPGTLADIDKWKARIVLGNSMGEGKKKGDMDEVGYVGINVRTNEVVPIARADEHQAGYELLHHLHGKGAIRGAPQDFITLFPSTNYPHYTTRDTHAYAAAVKKWLAYGGPNVAVHSQDTRSSGRGDKNYVTDMEEYAALDGKVPYGQKGPSKPAREMLDHLEGTVSGLREGKVGEAAAHLKALWERLETFSSYTLRGMDHDEQQATGKKIAEMDERDPEEVGKVVRLVAKAMQKSLRDERGSSYSYVAGLYGTGDESDKRIEKAAGAEMNPPKKEGESSGLSYMGMEVVGSLEGAATALSSDNPMAQARVHRHVMALIQRMESLTDDVDGLGAALERLHRASEESTNIEDVKQALFAYNGVKNLLHNRLRQMEKDGVTKDKHFGDVKTALEEFDRLGQI